MELIYVVFTSLGSVAALFIFTKIMGHREMSQLSMFDFIIAITIGSIAAEMATDLEEFMQPLVSMGVYAVLSVLISYINCKSLKIRRFISGKSLILMEDGKIYEKNLLKARLDINEFLTQCRIEGYFDLAQIQTAILESNGKISFLPKSIYRPLTPKDINLKPSEEKPFVAIILDGEVLNENLTYSGNDIKWLEKQLRDQGVSDISEVMLAMCSSKNNLSIYLKTKIKLTYDIFQ